MMKQFLFVLLLILSSLPALPQGKVLSDTESDAVVKRLTKMTAGITSMQCQFVQTKTMSMLADPSVTKGNMYYEAPNQICWEYTEPYSNRFIVSEKTVTVQSESKTDVIDLNNNRMYKSISDIVLGSVSGKKLFDKNVFGVELFSGENQWIAVLSPIKRDMKRMFKKLTFYYDKETDLISKVEFVSSDDDVTSIRFKNMKLNQAINPDKFSAK